LFFHFFIAVLTTFHKHLSFRKSPRSQYAEGHLTFTQTPGLTLDLNPAEVMNTRAAIPEDLDQVATGAATTGIWRNSMEMRRMFFKPVVVLSLFNIVTPEKNSRWISITPFFFKKKM